MQGTALSVYGLTYSSRKNLGKISVGDKDVSMNALINRIILITFFSLQVNHKATPVIAIINVGDSAL